MANTFKNATFIADLAANVDSPAIATVATTSPATQTTIIGMTVANTTSGVISVGVKLIDSSANEAWIVKDAPIPTGGSLVVSSAQKICMETGDHLKVRSNTANSIDVIVSYLEIT